MEGSICRAIYIAGSFGSNYTMYFWYFWNARPCQGRIITSIIPRAPTLSFLSFQRVLATSEAGWQLKFSGRTGLTVNSHGMLIVASLLPHRQVLLPAPDEVTCAVPLTSLTVAKGSMR
jgi:hypothetical protein